jgi:tRNA(Leu) C34 or U34 (ribose-2'-O)-methylase TrmL
MVARDKFEYLSAEPGRHYKLNVIHCKDKVFEHYFLRILYLDGQIINMSRTLDPAEQRYFGIGIYRPKTAENIGTLWRTAYIYGASFIFVIEAKYNKKSCDVLKVWSKIPLFQYESTEAFLETVPYSCKLVGVEMDQRAIPIKEYVHPDRAVYLLGSEDNGIPKIIKDKCQDLIVLPGERSLNVAVAGSIVVFDRVNKLGI